VARSATRTVRALADAGVVVEVLSWTRGLAAGQRQSYVIPPGKVEGAGVIVHRLGLFANLDYSLQHTLSFLELRHRQDPYEGVWGHAILPAGFLAVLFARSVGIPATVSARGNDIDLLMFPPGDFARLEWTLKGARSITAVSADLAKKIRLLTSADQHVRVVPNSVDLELYQANEGDESLKGELGIFSEEAVLVFSGELRHKKGLLPLLTAFREVRHVRPACLLVIGEIRVRDQSALSMFSAEDPVARSRMLVTGHLADPKEVARHLQLGDLFLQPSYWDGLPNAVLEAMACEKVVLASDAGGIPEVIEHGQSGFLLSRCELDRLGAGILELLTLSTTQRQAIGRAARQRICDHFSAEREQGELQGALADLWGTSAG